jgi:hypothetical protein
MRQPPTYRVTANDEQWVLVASLSCPCCNGWGHGRDSEGDIVNCGCAFHAADTEVLDAIDMGAAYVIVPHPEVIAFSDAVNRGLRKSRS